MNKTSLVYATKTKHSRKIAEAVATALGIKAQNIREKPVLKDIGLLFIAGGIYGGESMPELLDFIRGLDAAVVRRVALLTSCGSGIQKQATVRKILEERGIEVIDEFVCKGAILFVSVKHPNQKDLQDAVDFAQKIIQKRA
jgi:flavodoxin